MSKNASSRITNTKINNETIDKQREEIEYDRYYE